MDYQMDYQCLPTGDSTLFVAEMRTSCKQGSLESHVKIFMVFGKIDWSGS